MLVISDLSGKITAVAVRNNMANLRAMEKCYCCVKFCWVADLTKKRRGSKTYSCMREIPCWVEGSQHWGGMSCGAEILLLLGNGK